MRATPVVLLTLCLTAGAARAEAAPGQVIVVQVPGASGAELAALWREGALEAGGFRAFLAGGERTLSLPPADPSLPFAGSVALATGAPPGASGVVGDRLRPPGAAVGERVEIGGDHAVVGTLWNAALAADKVVGAVLWPGLDNRDDLRRATWGIADRDTLHYPPRPFKLERADWVDDKYGVGPGPSALWGLPKGVESFSTPLNVSAAFTPIHERAELIYVLVAIDRTDDGVVNYDGLLVSSRIDPKKGYVGIAEPGEWFRIDLVDPTGLRHGAPEVVWLKVEQLAPDLSKSVFYISASRFIKAFPSALVRKLESAGTTWPGPPDEAAASAGEAGGYGVSARTYTEMAERLVAWTVDVAVTGLDLYPTDLLLLSIPVFDPIDRRLLLVDPRQPGHRAERAERYRELRRQVWAALDRELARLLDAVDLTTTTVYLVSPYANVPVHSEVDVGEVLRAAPELTAISTPPERRWRSVAASDGLAHVYLSVAGRDAGGVLDAGAARRAARAVRDALARARDGAEPLFEKVLLRDEAAALGLDRPESGDVIAFARPGYRLVDSSQDLVPVTRRPKNRAAAGYAASLPESHGFLLVAGRGVRAGKERSRAELTDVARRAARQLGIAPPGRAR